MRGDGRGIGEQSVERNQRGELSLDEAVEQTATATRRFSRRQDSWFRKDPRVIWVRWDDPERVERAVEAVASTG